MTTENKQMIEDNKSIEFYIENERKLRVRLAQRKGPLLFITIISYFSIFFCFALLDNVIYYSDNFISMGILLWVLGLVGVSLWLIFVLTSKTFKTIYKNPELTDEENLNFAIETFDRNVKTIDSILRLNMIVFGITIAVWLITFVLVAVL